MQAGRGWLAKVTRGWQAGRISNLDYLLYCNLAAGRSFNDLTQVADCSKIATSCKLLESFLLEGHAHMCVTHATVNICLYGVGLVKFIFESPYLHWTQATAAMLCNPTVDQYVVLSEHKP